MIRILIADDHRLFREGLARMLNDTPELTVVASVSNGQEAIARAAETQPDVILMDVNMPVLDGVEAARQLRASLPQAQLLMLTVSEREQHLFAAIRAGARGYVLKNISSAELVEAIRRVHAGEAIIAPSMALKLLDEFAALSAEAQRRETGGEDLGISHLTWVEAKSTPHIGADESLYPAYRGCRELTHAMWEIL
jgi:two-component system NarL family response regulator